MQCEVFCDQCGTPLSWEGDAGGVQAVEFYIGVMDEPEKFPPTLHASVKERLSWFDVNDGLPRHQGSSHESGVRRIYESGPDAMRGFCDQCGTPLSWEGDAGGVQAVEFYIGVMDEPEKFPPTLHASVKERLSWFDVNDGLPRHQGSSNEPAD